MLPIQASANSPGPAPWYSFYCENLPEGTEYVDLLIHLPKADSKYTDLVAENLPEGITAESEIVAYCKDDYRSYSFHYEDARSAIRVGGGMVSSFFTDEKNGENAEIRYDHADDIEKRGPVRLAMLDKDGNIIKVSGLLRLAPKGFMAQSLGSFHYDAAKDVLEVDSYESGVGIILYILLGIIGLIFTCWVEWLAALPFKLVRWYGSLIAMTNLVSQILMRVSFVVLYDLFYWNYYVALLVFEVLVYTGEFLFYRWRMRDVSWKKCLAYTVTANSVSLILGIYINRVLLFN